MVTVVLSPAACWFLCWTSGSIRQATGEHVRSEDDDLNEGDPSCFLRLQIPRLAVAFIVPSECVVPGLGAKLLFHIYSSTGQQPFMGSCWWVGTRAWPGTLFLILLSLCFEEPR